MAESLRQLRDHNARLLVSGDFNDAVLHCRDAKIKVHRAVLCRSEYLANAFKGHFKEAESAVINLHDDPLEGVISMLLYLYCDDVEYKCLGHLDRPFFSTWLQPLMPDWDPKMTNSTPKYYLQAYIVADEYQVQAMKEAVIKWFHNLFAANYQYMDEHHDEGVFEKDVIEAIPLFYHDSIPARLRYSLVHCIHSYQQHFESMEKAGLCVVLEELPELAWDMIRMCPREYMVCCVRDPDPDADWPCKLQGLHDYDCNCGWRGVCGMACGKGMLKDVKCLVCGQIGRVYVFPPGTY